MPAPANTDICPTCNKVCISDWTLHSLKNSPLTQRWKSSSDTMDYLKPITNLNQYRGNSQLTLDQHSETSLESKLWPCDWGLLSVSVTKTKNELPVSVGGAKIGLDLFILIQSFHLILCLKEKKASLNVFVMSLVFPGTGFSSFNWIIFSMYVLFCHCSSDAVQPPKCLLIWNAVLLTITCCRWLCKSSLTIGELVLLRTYVILNVVYIEDHWWGVEVCIPNGNLLSI